MTIQINLLGLFKEFKILILSKELIFEVSEEPNFFF